MALKNNRYVDFVRVYKMSNIWISTKVLMVDFLLIQWHFVFKFHVDIYYGRQTLMKLQGTTMLKDLKG